MTKKALKLFEFNELSIGIQLHLIHKDGVYIGKRSDQNLSVILYQLYGFYVEVYYKEYRKIIERIFTTEDPVILHPYLNQVYIRDLDKGKQ